MPWHVLGTRLFRVDYRWNVLTRSKKLINRVKANQPILAQTFLYQILTSKKCIVFMWFAPISSIIVNTSYIMTILTKEWTNHGNRSHVLWNNQCINYLLANDGHKSQITSTRHPHKHDTHKKQLVLQLTVCKWHA